MRAGLKAPHRPVQEQRPDQGLPARTLPRPRQAPRQDPLQPGPLPAPQMDPRRMGTGKEWLARIHTAAIFDWSLLRLIDWLIVFDHFDIKCKQQAVSYIKIHKKSGMTQ